MALPCVPFRRAPARQVAQQLFTIFNHSKLQRDTHLRRREPDTWSIPHRLTHIPDEPLYFVGSDFLTR
jgi:hypothetical protein